MHDMSHLPSWGLPPACTGPGRTLSVRGRQRTALQHHQILLVTGLSTYLRVNSVIGLVKSRYCMLKVQNNGSSPIIEEIFFNISWDKGHLQVCQVFQVFCSTDIQSMPVWETRQSVVSCSLKAHRQSGVWCSYQRSWGNVSCQGWSWTDLSLLIFTFIYKTAHPPPTSYRAHWNMNISLLVNIKEDHSSALLKLIIPIFYLNIYSILIT